MPELDHDKTMDLLRVAADITVAAIGTYHAGPVDANKVKDVFDAVLSAVHAAYLHPEAVQGAKSVG